MKIRVVRFVCVMLFFSLFPPAFSQSTSPAPYKDDEFPQGLKDLRRFEIITLGALPFVTMDTALVFSTVDYISGGGSFPSPFPSKDYESFSDFMTDPMILTSIGISVGIGITDYIVRLIKRTKKNRTPSYKDIVITPVEEDPSATRIPLPPPNAPEFTEEEPIEVFE